MTVTSPSLGRALGLIVLLWIGGCAKGATTLDETANGSGGTGGTGASTKCGNGIIDPNEQCDPAAALSTTCANMNMGTGVLACNKITCAFDTSMCAAPASGMAGTMGH
jgi:hypothetical protein